MKFLNNTNTIVLLYDGQVMHGQINPGCTSVEIDDEVAQRSMAIQGFLAKGIIKVVPSDTNIDVPLSKLSQDTVTLGPKTTIDMTQHTGTFIATEPYVAKEGKTVVAGKTSIDFVPDINTAEVIMTNTKDIMGGDAKRIVDIIKENSGKYGKKLQASIDEAMSQDKNNSDRAAKIASAPKEIKDYLELRHIAKKWVIAKSSDVIMLNDLLQYEDPDSAAYKLIQQRLKELVAS